MPDRQQQYFYTLELDAIREQLAGSIDQVHLLREKALKRNDVAAADEIGQLQHLIECAKSRVGSLNHRAA
jgi:hypothetical protein